MGMLKDFTDRIKEKVSPEPHYSASELSEARIKGMNVVLKDGKEGVITAVQGDKCVISINGQETLINRSQIKGLKYPEPELIGKTVVLTDNQRGMVVSERGNQLSVNINGVNCLINKSMVKEVEQENQKSTEKDKTKTKDPNVKATVHTFVSSPDGLGHTVEKINHGTIDKGGIFHDDATGEKTSVSGLAEKIRNDVDSKDLTGAEEAASRQLDELNEMIHDPYKTTSRVEELGYVSDQYQEEIQDGISPIEDTQDDRSPIDWVNSMIDYSDDEPEFTL